MGQLDVYSLIDAFLIIVFGGFLTGYFSEEVGATAAQISSVSYSGNFIVQSFKNSGVFGVKVGGSKAAAFSSNGSTTGISSHKKLKKVLKTFLPVQDSREAVYNTWVVVDLKRFKKFEIHKSINEKMLWLDLEIAGYGDKTNENSVRKLGVKHNWAL